MTTPELILASGSPRRRELLASMGMRFDIITADVVGIMDPAKMRPAGLAGYNAGLKARAVAAQNPGRWVLGADTIVVLGERVFGKPPTVEIAAEYLAALGGKTHEVITGCCLVNPRGNVRSFHDVTRVTFRPLAPKLIESYLAAVQVLDKAGGYALQENGEWLVERVDGSRDNVLGLPTEKLEHELRAVGLL